MKKIVFIFLIAFVSTAIHAQDIFFNWAKQTGQNLSNYTLSLSSVLDASGNIYTTGFFGGIIDFDPGPAVVNLSPYSENDIFITKSGPQGNLIWAKQIGGVGSPAQAYSIALDAAGNIYLTGGFFHTVDFDTGPGVYSLQTSGGQNIFVAKYDPAGNFVWARQMDQTLVYGNTYGSSIAVDVAGNVCVTGYFVGTVDFDPGAGIYNLVSTGTNEDVFVCKLNSNGNFLWAKRIGGPGFDRSNSLAIDASGNVYTTGSIASGTVDFDPGPGVFNLTNSDDLDIFILKLDPAGNFIWAKQMEGSGYDRGFAIKLDGAGNIYTTGTFDGTVDFDPGAGTFSLSPINGTIFVSKLDANGNFIWAKQWGDGIGYAIAIDAAGNVYTTGGLYGTSDFDPGTGVHNLSAVGDQDIFVSKLDAAGNFIWAKQLGGDQYDWCGSILIDAAENVYTTGYFMGTADFDPGPGVFNLNSVNFASFVLKLSPCASITTSLVTASACNTYTWNGQTYNTSGDYTATFKNANGCDSVVTLRLTIAPRVSTEINQTICEGQDYAGYTISGIYTDTLVTVNGCDSIRTLRLTVQPQPVPLLGVDTELCPGDSVVLNPGQFSSYVWQDSSTKNSFVAKRPGLYSVVVTNNCGSAKDEILIKEKSCGIYFPSAFTPNNDGKNDVFKILGGNNLSSYRLIIYNRYGQKIFESTDYTKGWTGDINGKVQTTGVYIWQCEFKRPGTESLTKMKGTVTLIR